MRRETPRVGLIAKIKFYTSDFWLILAIVFVLLKFVFWSLAIKDLPLGYCAIFVSLTNVTILLSGKIFFKETITKNKILALVFILSGVFLINL